MKVNFDIIYEIMKYVDIKTGYILVGIYPIFTERNYYLIFINKYLIKLNISLNISQLNKSQLRNLYKSLLEIDNKKVPKDMILIHLCKDNNETILFRLLLSNKKNSCNYNCIAGNLIHECILNNNINKIDIISSIIKNKKIIISKTVIRILMEKKYYKMLNKVIELYLGKLINLNLYFIEIYNNFDYTECLSLCKNFSELNNIKLLS